jgi:hypothetical protein
MLAAVSRTSTQSLYRRLFTVRRHFSEAETSFFLNPDFLTHELIDNRKGHFGLSRLDTT